MPRRFIPTTLLLVACLLLPASGLAGECSPNLNATLDGEEPMDETTTLQFSVDVSVNSSCAVITYDLVLDIRIPNGQVKKVRKVREVKLSDGSLTEMVRHEMSRDSSLIDYRVKLVKCETC